MAQLHLFNRSLRVGHQEVLVLPRQDSKKDRDGEATAGCLFAVLRALTLCRPSDIFKEKEVQDVLQFAFEYYVNYFTGSARAQHIEGRDTRNTTQTFLTDKKRSVKPFFCWIVVTFPQCASSLRDGR